LIVKRAVTPKARIKASRSDEEIAIQMPLEKKPWQ
jgi:hypothetical protein